MVPIFPSYWKPDCKFFRRPISEHLEHGHSAGPREGGEIRPTSEQALSFKLSTPTLSLSLSPRQLTAVRVGSDSECGDKYPRC